MCNNDNNNNNNKNNINYSMTKHIVYHTAIVTYYHTCQIKKNQGKKCFLYQCHYSCKSNDIS